MTRQTKTFLVLSLAALFIAVGALHWINPPPKPAPLSPQRQARQLARQIEINRAHQALKALKESMRNPASFQLIAGWFMKDGTVCFEYRAQNGFGGMDIGHTVWPAGGSKLVDDEVKWNQLCAGKSGYQFAGH